MAKDGQVCFHRGLFADPVKPQRCTTEPVRPLDGINKDVGGAKLLQTPTFVYPVDCTCICPLLKTQHHCQLCPNGSCNPPSASHPPPPPRHHPPTRPPLIHARPLYTPTHPPTPYTRQPTHPLIHAIPDITVTVKKLLKIQQF